MKTQRWLALLAAVGLAGRVSAQDQKESLIALTKIAASYRVTLADKRMAKLNEEPVIRWTKRKKRHALQRRSYPGSG